MKIRRSEADAMVAHALEGYPFETCGVLLAARSDGRSALRAVRAQNRETEEPRVRYQINPGDLIGIQRDARKDGLEIIGYYHSHPDHPARPSEADRRIAAEGLSDGVFHVVIGVEKGERGVPTAWVFREATQAFEEEPLDIV
jgi:proteasome lid subunit RPN8/RPN11